MKIRYVFIISFLIGSALAIGYIIVKRPQAMPTMHAVEQMTTFSLENAPSQSLKGMITSLSGNVYWQSRIATTPMLLQQPRTIQQGEELSTEKDGKVTVEITQACSLTLRPQSHITFIQTLPANIVFDQNTGTGEYQTLGTIPVSIHSLDLLIQINSGKAVITTDKKQQTVTVVVTEGSVTAAYNDNTQETHTLTLGQGKQFVFDSDTKQITL